jgi:hypothetical protein
MHPNELRVVRGEPTAEELAVVTALISASSRVPERTTTFARGRWNDPAHQLRRTLTPGPGAWRAAWR